MDNRITLNVQIPVMLAFIMFGVSVIFSSNTFPTGADNTKISEKPIITASQNQTASDTGKKTKNSFSNGWLI